MRRILFLIAFIFLANPLVSNVDILPDFIAYILMMIALAKPSYFDVKAFSAYKNARTMVIISFFKLISVYFTTIYIDITLSLLFSFVFFAIELIFGIPFFIKLFGYFSNVALATDNAKILRAYEAFRTIAIVIFAIKLLLATLPDFSILTAQDTLTTSFKTDLTRFRPIFILFSLILSTPLSGLWILLYSVFICTLFGKKEELYIKEEFGKKIQNKSQHYEIKANYRFLFLLAGLSIFAFGLRIDNVNIFINTALPIGFIIFYLLLAKKKYLKINKFIYCLFGVTAMQLIFRLLELKNSIEFSNEYNLEAVLKISRAETMYYESLPFAIIGTILFAITILIMLMLLVNSTEQSIKKNSDLYSSSEIVEYTIASFKKRIKPFLIVTSVLAMLNSITYPLMIYFLPENDLTEKIVIGAKTMNVPIYSIFIPINMIASSLFVISFILTMLIIYDSVFKKMYEKISLN